MEHTKSTASYIEAINKIQNKLGYCRSVDVSREVGNTPGSTSTALKLLEKKGMIQFNNHKMITLTIEAKNDLLKFNRNREFLRRLFVNSIAELNDYSQELIYNQIDDIFFLMNDEFMNTCYN